MKARDVMSPVTDFLSPEDTLQEAVVKMHTGKSNEGLGVRGMVVLDEQGEIAGVLSIKDIIRATIPVYLDPKLARFSWDGMLEKMAESIACSKVKDFMSEEIVTVTDNASLMTCADLLIKKYLQRLPVVSEEGRVVGIVTIGDVYNVISNIFTIRPECKI